MPGNKYTLDPWQTIKGVNFNAGSWILVIDHVYNISNVWKIQLQPMTYMLLRYKQQMSAANALTNKKPSAWLADPSKYKGANKNVCDLNLPVMLGSDQPAYATTWIDCRSDSGAYDFSGNFQQWAYTWDFQPFSSINDLRTQGCTSMYQMGSFIGGKIVEEYFIDQINTKRPFTGDVQSSCNTDGWIAAVGRSHREEDTTGIPYATYGRTWYTGAHCRFYVNLTNLWSCWLYDWKEHGLTIAARHQAQRHECFNYAAAGSCQGNIRARLFNKPLRYQRIGPLPDILVYGLSDYYVRILNWDDALYDTGYKLNNYHAVTASHNQYFPLEMDAEWYVHVRKPDLTNPDDMPIEIAAGSFSDKTGTVW
ncbi:MAG: hypothetical protein ACWGQW_08140 [bacterium]